MADLEQIAATCARIEGRLDEIKHSHEIAIRGVHRRINEVKADVERDVDRVESEVRRPAAAAGGTVALLVGIVGEALRRIIGV